MSSPSKLRPPAGFPQLLIIQPLHPLTTYNTTTEPNTMTCRPVDLDAHYLSMHRYVAERLGEQYASSLTNDELGDLFAAIWEEENADYMQTDEYKELAANHEVIVTPKKEKYRSQRAASHTHTVLYCDN